MMSNFKKLNRFLACFCTLALLLTSLVLPSSTVMASEADETTIDYSVFTNRIEPENYCENSLEGSKLRRDYTFIYDDGMNDKMVEMGSYVYASGNDNAVGVLTYKLPYAVTALLLTGIEVPDDPDNHFQGFQVSSDGKNWKTFNMTATYEDKVFSAVEGRDVGGIRGVKYHGSTEEEFRYFRVEFGRNWLPGINYLYIPASSAIDDCANKVDPTELTYSIACSDSDAKLGRNAKYTYDGVVGAAVTKAGATVSYTLPYAVNSMAFTAIEIYWPNTTREQFHYRNIEVSADGENWTDFTMAAGNFEYVEQNAGSGPLNGKTIPVHYIGVKYFGTNDTPFRYIRMKTDSAWNPALCNFYLPNMKTTHRIEPENYYANTLADECTPARYFKTGCLLYNDGMNKEMVVMSPFVYALSGAVSGKLSYKLPYAVNEILLTGVQAANTESPSRFTTFEVSSDGETWVTLDMTETAKSGVVYVAGVINDDYAGVEYYGNTVDSFRYFRVGLGRGYCPGINYLYIPESNAEDYSTVKLDPATLTHTSDNINGDNIHRNGTIDYDGVKGLAFNDEKGGTVTYTLPKAVTSMAFTAIEIYWPNASRERFHFKNIEVSADGNTWTDFTMAASGFSMVQDADVRTDNPQELSLNVKYFGVKYFGINETPFSYIRMKSDTHYNPQLCNFYLPDSYTGVTGDANGDFNFDILDLVRIKKYLVGNGVKMYVDGDLNSDNEINTLDMSIVRKMLLNVSVEASAFSTYYVDASSGSDDNNGLTKSTAFQSLDRLNSIQFRPGDKVLFKKA